MFTEIARLMEDGQPVCVTFQKGCKGEYHDLLYCEMITKARRGDKFIVRSQSCPSGKYVLGTTEKKPDAYYLSSGRYSDAEIAQKAASELPRIKKEYDHIKIEPLSESSGDIDVIILYLEPEKAMRLVQALAYNDGKRVSIDTFGAASICGDCTAIAIENGIGLSYGCKGSRKHTEYFDTEIPIGISFDTAKKIEIGLKNIPETRH